MPKGKKKGKYEHRRTEQPYSSDEDAGIDMTMHTYIDNCSETSGQSDLKSNHDDAESEIQEKLEEKVLELIEGLGARSAAARATAFTSLRSALQRRLMGAVLAPQRATLADHVARAVRRGRDAERQAAAALAPLLALQIGEEDAEEYMHEVRPALAAAAVDRTASLDARAECCSALAVLCYLLDEDVNEILEILLMYETIFSGSYLKGDGSVKVSGAAVEEGAWHAAALDGWALALAALPAHHARHVLERHPPSFSRLAHLLHAHSLEVRLAAGGALVIAHELATEAADSDEEEAGGEGGGAGAAWGGAGGAGVRRAILEQLRQLANDSHKYRAKRDRKLQRATFRDILKYFEEGTVAGCGAVVCGEAVRCDTWCARAAYAALAASLGAGVSALAPRSPALRHALRLPPDAPAVSGAVAARPNKLQRHLQNTAACKARTVARNKNRDKRSAALAL